MKNKSEKMDLRILRTNSQLRVSLLKLMMIKSVSKITPTELCREAGINRNTFYAHYKSVEDLLYSLEDEIYEQVRRSLLHLTCLESTLDVLKASCQIVYANKDICILLFSDKGNDRLLQRITELGHDTTIAHWKSEGMNESEDKIEMLYTFYVNCNIAAIKRWVLTGMAENINDLALLMERATNLGLQEFCKN